MQAFEIERQAHQTPFSSRRRQASQRELSEAEDFFDDANDRLHSAFTQTINCSSDLGLEFVSHLDNGTSLLYGWSGCCWKKVCQSR